MMNIYEAAQRLNGNEYGKEGSDELWAEMKSSGLVAVFGASDDLMEFRGAVDDEEGAYGGAEVPFTKAGMLKNRCDDDDCPYHAKLRENATTVNAFWNKDGFSWTYETDIPHATFIIKEDGDNYCQGIVFALTDVPSDANGV